jgi:hypothetical protein
MIAAARLRSSSGPCFASHANTVGLKPEWAQLGYASLTRREAPIGP